MEIENDLPGWCHLNFDTDIELGERIGGGGVGVIYKGWMNNQAVALKTLFDPRVDEKLKKEYLDELLVMSKLQHSNIVSFLGACMVPPNLCFVMELCEDSIFHMLHVNHVQFSEEEIIHIALDVGYAMEYLHAQRPAIIHRDLKTHNLLKAYDGHVKICDFGLVKVANPQAGTPAYMAPELFQNKPYNKSVDVYSFGVVFWELFCGEIPFYMVDIPDIRQRVLAGDRPKIPNSCPQRWANLIRQCWHQRAEERPTFSEIVDELLAIQEALPQSRHTAGISDFDALDGLLRK